MSITRPTAESGQINIGSPGPIGPAEPIGSAELPDLPYSRGWEDGCADYEILCLPDTGSTDTIGTQAEHRTAEHDRIHAKLEAAQMACLLALHPSSALPGCAAPIDEADMEYASGYSEGFEALGGALARERAAASLTRNHSTPPEGSAEEHEDRAGSSERSGHDTRG